MTGGPFSVPRPQEGQGPLTLPLPIEAPGPPARLELEEPMPCEAAFDAAAWRFSVDWDGMRVVVGVSSDGTVQIHDERLRDVTARLPEIAAAIPSAMAGRAALLEGVVCLLDGQGCPDLPTLAERLSEGGEPPLTGVVLLVTDLLHLDRAAVTGWPFDRRRAALLAALSPTPHVQFPDVVAGQGRAVADAAASRSLPAVLARHGAAPYRPGVASPQRLRIAMEPRVDTVVAGVVRERTRGGDVTALLLAEWEGGRLVDAGRAVAPSSRDVQRWLRERAGALASAAPPLDTVAAQEAGAGATWLRPSLVATVRHHGRGTDGRLRLPALVALREDRAARWCIRRDAVAPPAAGGPSGGGFRPTVIATLPMGDG